MPELVILTTGSPRNATKNVAARAASEFEQFAQKNDSPYWDVTAATSKIDTVAKATGEAEVQGGKSDPLVFEAGYPRATALLEDAFEETRSVAQERLGELATVLEEATQLEDDSSSTETGGMSDVLAADTEVVEEVLEADVFVDAAADIGARFGRVYRVFDVTGHSHGHPVRSYEGYESIKEDYADRRETLYVVKLLARQQ